MPQRHTERSLTALDEIVYERIRDGIADGTHASGAPLRASRIAADLGVSRTPVVSALKRLGQDGLVEWVANSGARVRALTFTETAQIFELREVLEGLAARHAAINLKPATIDRLARLFDTVEANLDSGSEAGRVRTFLRHDRTFHLTIIDAAAHPALERVIEQVHVTTRAFAAGLVRTVADSLADHAQIIAAFRARDAEAAEAAMRQHLRQSVELLYRQSRLTPSKPATSTRT